MSIYRGAGGSGDAVADSSSEALLIRALVVGAQADADAAAASATSAGSSASDASTSASNAATSAANASNSATAAASSAFPSGTALLFQQTSAPTGWTKSTTHDNKSLRVVSGAASSGGTVDFTTAFASKSVTGTNSSYALTTADIPSHTHSFSGTTGTVSADHNHGFSVSGNTNLVTTFPAGASALHGAQSGNNFNGSQITFNGSGTTGGASANHTHTYSGTTGGTGSGGGHTHTFTGTAINLAVQYVDVIIATKD
jgi:hypothetical protein